MQAKLLRVARAARGAAASARDRARTVDVRVVAATNRDLAARGRRGRASARTSTTASPSSSCASRRSARACEDLRLLVDHIQDELARRRAAAALPPLARLDETAIAMLLRYDFPGNVRELRNVVERWAVLGAAGSPGDPGGRRSRRHRASAASSARRGPDDVDARCSRCPYHEAKDAWIDRFERGYVDAILEQSGGNVSKAARDAGVDRRHLQRLMARFGIKASE